MTASDRMTPLLTRIAPARLQDIVEEIVNTIYDHGDDDRGLHMIHLQLIRPDEKRTYISYKQDDPSSQPKAGT